MRRWARLGNELRISLIRKDRVSTAAVIELANQNGRSAELGQWLSKTLGDSPDLAHLALLPKEVRYTFRLILGEQAQQGLLAIPPALIIFFVGLLIGGSIAQLEEKLPEYETRLMEYKNDMVEKHNQGEDRHETTRNSGRRSGCNPGENRITAAGLQRGPAVFQE